MKSRQAVCRKQSAWPVAVSSQEHCRDRHLHLPQTRECVRTVGCSRRCKQKAKAHMNLLKRALWIVGLLMECKTFSKFSWKMFYCKGFMRGCTAVKWWVLFSHRKQVLGSHQSAGWGLSTECLNVILWLSGFTPGCCFLFKDMLVGFNGES